MIEAFRRNRPPLFAIVACTISAVTFGLFCWNSTLRSNAEPTTRDYLFLLLYQSLSLISHLGALWYFARKSNFRGGETIVVLFLVSAMGTIIPYVASSIQIWLTHQLDLASFLRHSALAWLLYVAVMLMVMAVTSTGAYIMTLPFRHTTRHAADV